jgi:glycosyltransferase involved in cell wall biosynthesis
MRLDPNVRVLVVTKIFPNALEPTSSAFNRQQLSALSAHADVEVLVAIPWFPFARLARKWSRAGRLGALPATDVIDGVSVAYPRVAYLPLVGDAVAAPLYGASMLPALLRRRGRFDVLLGAWAFPDGVAAIDLARLLGVPAVVKAHGSDLNVEAEKPRVRSQLQRALPRAAGFVAPSRALVARAVALGADPDRAVHVPNGVDVARFHPMDRAAARASLGLPADAPLVVYVGRIERAKGLFELVEAFAAVRRARPDARLVLVGEGGASEALREAAKPLGDALLAVGNRTHAEIPRFLAAADVFTLPSWFEGTPNVVLEALACGRRVVATRVGGIPDVVEDDLLGELVPPKDAKALGDALIRALSTAVDPAAIVERARVGTWDQSAARLRDVLARAVAEHPRRTSR